MHLKSERLEASRLMWMLTFIMLTRLSHEALVSPRAFEELGAVIGKRLKERHPDVAWRASYALMGPADFLDVFSAPCLETAMDVAALVRSYGHATTEVWPAIERDVFKTIVRSLAADG